MVEIAFGIRAPNAQAGDTHVRPGCTDHDRCLQRIAGEQRAFGAAMAAIPGQGHTFGYVEHELFDVDAGRQIDFRISGDENDLPCFYLRQRVQQSVQIFRRIIALGNDVRVPLSPTQGPAFVRLGTI